MLGLLALDDGFVHVGQSATPHLVATLTTPNGIVILDRQTERSPRASGCHRRGNGPRYASRHFGAGTPNEISSVWPRCALRCCRDAGRAGAATQHPVLDRGGLVREQGPRILGSNRYQSQHGAQGDWRGVRADQGREAANPKTDVWYGGTHDPHLQAANEGLLQPYVSANMKEQYPWSADLLAKSGNQVAGIYRSPWASGYNRELLAKEPEAARLLERSGEAGVRRRD